MSYKLVNPATLLANDSTAKEEIGIERQDVDGNVYKYIKANEALAIGQSVVAVAETTWDSAVLDEASSSGDTEIDVDTKAAAVTANQFKDYYIGQAAASGKGMFHKIKYHEAALATASFNVTFETAIAEAFGNGVALRVYAPWLMELTDALTEMVHGIAIGTITTDYYGWIQIGGFCRAVLCGHSTSTATVINEPLKPIAALAGSLMGSTGTVSAEEAAAGTVIALQTLALNTVGYIPGLIKRHI